MDGPTGGPGPEQEDEGIDPELLEELRGVFKDEASVRLTELRQGLAAGDASGVARAAHRLAGDAAAVGLAEVERVAREVLEAARGGQLEGVAPLVDALEGMLGQE